MANIRISQLPTAPSPITGSELIPIVQSGQTVQTTVSAIVNSPVQTQTFLTKNQETTLPNSRYLAVGAGLSLADGGAQSTYSITPVGALASLVSAGQGFMVKTSGTDITNRSIAVNTTGLSVTNGDGTTGNPTISLTNNLLSLAGATGTGLVAIAGNNSLSIITIAGTDNQIAVTNGSTSPVIGLASNPIVPGNASITLPSGGTLARPSGINGMLRYNSDINALEAYANGAWGTIVSGSGVSSFSAGTTGFTPSTSTTGAVVLAGTLKPSNGGTGATTLTGYVYGNGTSTMTASTTIPTSSLSGTISLTSQVSGILPILNGGTGQSTASTAFNALSPVTTLGDLIVGTGTNTNGRIGIGSNGQILTVVSGAPAWANPATAGTVTSVSFTGGIISVANPTTTPALTVTGTQGGIPYFNTSSAWTTTSTLTLYGVVYGGGTTVAPSSTGAGTTGQVLLANTSAAPTWGQVSLTAGVTGILPIANGGTNSSATATAGGVGYGTGTAHAYTAVGTSGQVLVSGGAGAPTWSTLSGVAVTTLSFGTTGLTPSTATSGAITVAGTLVIANGGTGLTTLTAGYIPYGNGTGALNSSSSLNYSGTLLSSTAYTASGTITGSSTTGVYAYGTLGYSDVNHVLTMQSSQNSYIQMEIQNTNTGSSASADVVVGNNLTTATTYYGDFGMNSSGWAGTAGTNSFGAPNMVYLTATTGDILVGTTTANAIRLAVGGGADAMKVDGTTSIVSFPTTGAITLPAGTTAQQPTGVAGMLRFNSTTTQFEGYNGTTWSSVGGAAISNDTTTSTNVYPLFASATSGTALTVYTSNAKYLYKPSTGELQSSVLVASNGIVVNALTVATNYTIASGYSGSSAGPITVASGVTVTVASGSRWVVL